jgi:photosystem II stability/assembly factor-like uncharacterized protein
MLRFIPLYCISMLAVLTATSIAQPVWAPVTQPPVGKKTFTIDVNDQSFFAATDLDIFSTTNDGKSWEKLSGLRGNPGIHQFWTSGPYLYATTGINGITDAETLNRSNDKGKNWDSLFEGYGRHYKQSNCLVFIGVFNDAGFNYSSDNGLTWNDISDSVPGRRANFEMWSPNFIICSIDSIHQFFLRTAITSDTGKTWKTISDIGDGLSYDGTSFFTCSSDGLFESTDTCQTWQLVSPDIAMEKFIISGKRMYSYSSHGVKYSVDRGRHWKAMNDGLTNLQIKDFLIGKDKLYVRVASGELFHTTFPSSVETTNPEKLSLSLSPNPASATCQIMYSIPSATVASITISDALGRVVAKPFTAEFQSAGNHLFSLNSKDFQPGVYYCSLKAGSQESVAKMVIAK